MIANSLKCTDLADFMDFDADFVDFNVDFLVFANFGIKLVKLTISFHSTVRRKHLLLFLKVRKIISHFSLNLQEDNV